MDDHCSPSSKKELSAWPSMQSLGVIRNLNGGSTISGRSAIDPPREESHYIVVGLVTATAALALGLAASGRRAKSTNPG